MRVGIFGGTFDPVHLGHLILAEQCREQAKLDQILFIPAALPPHKQQQPLTSFAHRAEMLTLAISGHSAFRVDELEKERAGPSYTVHTLTQLHEQLPGDEFCFILGSDSVHDLPIWYQPQRILELATLLVVARADWPVFSVQELKAKLQLNEDFPLRYQIVEAPLITIASRAIRRRIGEGRSVRYMIPRAVEAYIEDKGLYRETIRT
ncbi:MAG: nicotinate (nicotinamide) nucleotide adenylyltransferase [Gemmataceae bacterium]|nr:nicotinate (nicotinamide) nucleotide adenylyltransferase [Gemmataceae bacterium]